MIRFKIQDSILWAEIDCQKTRNSLTLEMVESFCNELKSSPASKIEGVLLSSRGSVFCSGGPLQTYSQFKTRDEGIELNHKMVELFRQIENYPVPKVAVVDGLCVGGGLEFLCCFDWITASPGALFGVWQRKMGLGFAWEGMRRLSKKIGPGKTKKLFISTEVFTAFEAREMGLVDQVEASRVAHGQAIRWLKRSRELSWAPLELYNDGVPELLASDQLWWNDTQKTILAGFRSRQKKTKDTD